MSLQTDKSARDYVVSLYHHLLKRSPRDEELNHWSAIATNEADAQSVFYAFIKSKEYMELNRVRSIFPIGHYYSPVVDPDSVQEYVKKERESASGLAGIDMSLDDMERFWNDEKQVISNSPFPEDESRAYFRYYYNNNIFSYGDAITLRAMISKLQPRRIIEIGSGFSSACMLDSIEEFALRTELTLVDPYMDRVTKLFRPEDYEKVCIIEQQVQKVELEIFTSLQKNDILFIDSTHVLKTGSDVHYELFHILPTLNPGVFVHFHDVHYPFEYPDRWIFDLNHSWNEIYALRAFLMYNREFHIRFWGSYFAAERRGLVKSSSELFLRNPGGSFWIERI